MSRPSQVEQAELEALEGMAALCVTIQRSTGFAGIRLRQVLRRAHGDERMLAVARPANEELGRIADAADDLHGMVCGLLETRQAERAAKNEGRTDG